MLKSCVDTLMWLWLCVMCVVLSYFTVPHKEILLKHIKTLRFTRCTPKSPLSLIYYMSWSIYQNKWKKVILRTNLYERIKFILNKLCCIIDMNNRQWFSLALCLAMLGYNWVWICLRWLCWKYKKDKLLKLCWPLFYHLAN